MFGLDIPDWVWVALVASVTLALREVGAVGARFLGDLLVRIAAGTKATWDDEAAAIAHDALDAAADALDKGDKQGAAKFMALAREALVKRR
jgi:hypothetical protein